MFTNHSNITVFSSKKIGRETFWNAAYLENVNFYGSDQLLVGDKEVKTSDEYIVRVPDAVLQRYRYVDPRTYKSLPLEETSNCFTLQKGDYIVKGYVDINVSSSADIIQNCEAMKIVSVTENLNASAYSRHIKLVVK